MNKIFATMLLATLTLAAAAGCTSQLRRETPIGHACYRTFSYEEYPRRYACLFELSDLSAFYDKSQVEKVLVGFMANEGGICTKGEERDVTDVETQHIDHGLRYRLYDIRCR